MNLNDLEDAVLEHFNYDTEAADSAARRRIRRHINQWQRRILETPGLQGLRDSTFSLTSVVGTATYGYPDMIAKIYRVYERTNDTYLDGRSLDWYRRVEPDPQSGTPSVFIPRGYQPVSLQPASLQLYIASSDVGDTTGYVAAEWVSSLGYQGHGRVIPTGLTRVTICNDDAVEVTKFYVSSAMHGDISLYDAVIAGNCLGVIKAGKLFSRYYSLTLWPTPSTAQTFYIDYQREITDMEHGTDESIIPTDFHYLLELGARISEYEKQDDSRRTVAEAHYSEGLAKLVARCNFPAGAVYVPGELETQLSSRLGPWFPRGS